MSDKVMSMADYKTFSGIPLCEVQQRLDVELEARAYKEIRGGKGQKLGLTDIAPAYLPDTLGFLFGPLGIGWGFEVLNMASSPEQVERQSGYTDTEWSARCDVRPWYAVISSEGKMHRAEMPNCPGASKNSMREWAEKGAVTNALGTAFFFLGWQMSVYKGKRSHTDFEKGDVVDNRGGQKQSSSAIDEDFAPPTKQERKAAPNPTQTTAAAAAAPAPVDPVADAAYVFDWGVHRGKKITDLDERELERTIAWCKKNNKQAGFVQIAERYQRHAGLPFMGDSPTPAAKGPAPIPPSEAMTEAERVLEARQKWVKLCLTQIEFFAGKGDREKAKDWAQTAVKKAESGEITPFDLEVIGTEYRKHFPNKIEGKQENLPLESKPASRYAELEAQAAGAKKATDKNKLVRLIMETFDAKELSEDEKERLLASLKPKRA